MKNLAYRTWGVRGYPTLIMLHGFLGNSDDWQGLAKQLENEFYLVAVDLPGHSNSRAVSIDPQDAFKSFSELLNESLNQLDLKHYSLLGYSLGGRLAMTHSIAHSHKLDKLILESAHPGLESDADRELRQSSDQEWAGRFRDEPLADVLQAWYHQPVFADLDCQARENLMQDRISANEDGRVLGDILAACSLSNQPACWGALSDVPFPVHYLYGDRDLKFTEVAQRLQALGAAAGARRIDQAGHNIHREQPEKMAAVIRKLFAEA